MKTLTMKLPKLKSRKCWIGVYGGHFDIVTIFNRKPEKDENFGYGFCKSDDEKVAGRFDFDTFVQWFGPIKPPESTIIEEIEEITLTANWDKYGQIIGLNPQAD